MTIRTSLAAKIHYALSGYLVNFKSLTAAEIVDNHYFVLGNIYGVLKKIPYRDFIAEFSILEELAMLYVKKRLSDGDTVGDDIWSYMNRGNRP